MANSSYGWREGLTVRPAASSSSSEISLQIDPINADLDDHILGLRGQVRKLRGVAQEIQSEAKYQNDFISQLALCKVVTKSAEDFKQGIRRARQKVVDTIKKSSSSMPKDDVKRLEKDVEELTKKFIKSADDMCKAKEKEISGN